MGSEGGAMAMAGGGSEAEAAALDFTPTWIVAAFCTILVLLSFVAERCLHCLSKTLKNKKALYEKLLEMKESFGSGTISLLLAVFQGTIQRTCIPASWTYHMLPCQRPDEKAGEMGGAKKHFLAAGVVGGIRRRLLGEGGASIEHCQKGKVPLLSLEAINDLQIFLFVLAITHFIFSVTTMILGSARIYQWKQWEDMIQKDALGNGPTRFFFVHQFEFIIKRFKGRGKECVLRSWLHSFGKQFYGSVSKSDYTTMRLGFIMTHCRGHPNFDFHRYMIRVLDADFKKVVSISWYLWLFMVIFLLLNVNGWHTYFWIAFLPLILLLVIGTKLEHVIDQLANDVAETHSVIEGDLVVRPSDDHFWFRQPRIILHLIHFILFQNAFEIAFFFWILVTYGFNSCIMGPIHFIVPRLVIGVLIQILCCYSTLPLYAIITQMGSCFKKEMFSEHVQQGILGWAQQAKMRKRIFNGAEGWTSTADSAGSSVEIEMVTAAAAEDSGTVGEAVRNTE